MSNKKDTTWSIKHEGKLNPNNIIFTNKYKELYKQLKKVDDTIVQVNNNDPGLLVCTVCNTGSNPAGHADKCDDIWIAYCNGCSDYGEFVYEKDL